MLDDNARSKIPKKALRIIDDTLDSLLPVPGISERTCNKLRTEIEGHVFDGALEGAFKCDSPASTGFLGAYLQEIAEGYQQRRDRFGQQVAHYLEDMASQLKFIAGKRKPYKR